MFLFFFGIQYTFNVFPGDKKEKSTRVQKDRFDRFYFLLFLNAYGVRNTRCVRDKTNFRGRIIIAIIVVLEDTNNNFRFYRVSDRVLRVAVEIHSCSVRFRGNAPTFNRENITALPPRHAYHHSVSKIRDTYLFFFFLGQY